MQKVIPPSTYWAFKPKAKKIILTRGTAFYGEYSKVEKPVMVTTSYEGSDEEKELEKVPVINNYDNINVITNSYSENDIKNDNE